MDSVKHEKIFEEEEERIRRRPQGGHATRTRSENHTGSWRHELEEVPTRQEGANDPSSLVFAPVPSENDSCLSTDYRVLIVASFLILGIFGSFEVCATCCVQASREHAHALGTGNHYFKQYSRT